MSKEEAVAFLDQAVISFDPYFKKSGQVVDPVFDMPMQYGTPYHALCRATLGLMVDDKQRASKYLDEAALGLEASINEILDPDFKINASGFNPQALGLGQLNHRDFYWPAVMQAWRVLKSKGHPKADQLGRGITSAKVPDVFRTMPPSNWAAVWLSGEYMRFKEKKSPYSLSMIDRWLGGFFKSHIDVEMGFYKEPGHPNSYDLFTRYHLLLILADGYKGQYAEAMRKLVVTGLKRSLAVQLSDGSMASAYRSTGQTWTLGVQIAFFTLAANYLKSKEEDLAKEARKAASLAYESFVRFQRREGTYSPVENILPSSQRVGHERYSFDANYSNLAMGFLSVALLNGFQPKPVKMKKRDASTFTESTPLYRGLAHKGFYSAHFNAFPNKHYDAYGLTDLTFGPGRYFHFAATVKHLESGGYFNIGMALRDHNGIGDVEPVCQKEWHVVDSVKQGEGKASLTATAHLNGSHMEHQYNLNIDDNGVHIEERMVGNNAHKSLLVPFLKDAGIGERTQVVTAVGDRSTSIIFTLGDESIGLEVPGKVKRVFEVETGFTGRRGWHAVLRIDFEIPTEVIHYRFYRIK